MKTQLKHIAYILPFLTVCQMYAAPFGLSEVDYKLAQELGVGGSLEKMREAIKEGANVNAKLPADLGGSMLTGAIMFKNLDQVRLLLQEGANPNIIVLQGSREYPEGISALHFAINQDSDGSVDLLMQHGAKVTPADIKAAERHPEVLHVLQGGHSRQFAHRFE